MSEPLLRVDGLTSGYGEIVAIRDVRLTVEPGEVVAVLGPNGAGKTTLLSTIAGLLPAIDGDVRLEGRSVAAEPAHVRSRGRIALVQENKRIFRAMTVRDNLLVAAPGARDAELRDRLDHVLELFPALPERMRHRAGTLSGGQQQMLAIGQALMARPRVLLLDEPSAGLAPNLVTSVMESVRTIAAAGIGVLLVEQTVQQALRIASRVYVLRLGECREIPDFRSAGQARMLEHLYLGRGTQPAASVAS